MIEALVRSIEGGHQQPSEFIGRMDIVRLGTAERG
jgi:hypothetical protein